MKTSKLLVVIFAILTISFLTSGCGKKAKNSKQGNQSQTMKENVEKEILEDFVLEDLEGNQVSVQSFYKKDQIVIVELWALW